MTSANGRIKRDPRTDPKILDDMDNIYGSKSSGINGTTAIHGWKKSTAVLGTVLGLLGDPFLAGSGCLIYHQFNAEDPPRTL